MSSIHIPIEAIEGHRLWAVDYDEAPNPLLALEMRLVSRRLPDIDKARVLDAGSGTGRWMQWAVARGAQVFGIDACHEMILKAEGKPGLAGRSARSELHHLPFGDDCVDLALCSFAIGYVHSPRRVIGELARVARKVLVTDLHPEAAAAGWSRSFRSNDRVYELIHYDHTKAELDDCAFETGLVPEWRIEAFFGAPEREIFRRAGKENGFDQVSRIPAVLATLWRK